MAGLTIQDAHSSVKVSIALPNAGNTVNSNFIDLGNNAPFPINEYVEVLLSISAATSANTKNINISLQDSNESNANFTNIAELSTWINLGAGTAYAAATRKEKLPSTSKRYIRATAVGETNGGNASDGTFSMQLLF